MWKHIETVKKKYKNNMNNNNEQQVVEDDRTNLDNLPNEKARKIIEILKLSKYFIST